MVEFEYRARDLLEVLQEVSGSNAIVNLSVKNVTNKEEMVEIQPYLGDQSNLFFVIAAGNQGMRVSGDPPIFPANNGDKANAITVAALMPGKPASLYPDSNWDPRLVQIAAPGCSVPVISYEFERALIKADRISGTSVAAPLVAFAAALIRAEGGNSLRPRDIKQRLLYSADLHPELKVEVESKKFIDAVQDGRVLNIVKAISLFHDVVEMNDGTLLMGDLRFAVRSKDDEGVSTLAEKTEAYVINLCDGRVSPKASDILKIVPNHGTDTSDRDVVVTRLARIYYRNGDGMLPPESCLLPPDLEIVVTNDKGELVHPARESIPLSEVKDIVRKHIPS